MKYLFIALSMVVFYPCGSGWADDAKLPLDKRISVERLTLIEEYQQSLLQCRQEKSKIAKDSCVNKRKARLAKTLEEMEENPRAYFMAKDKKNMKM